MTNESDAYWDELGIAWRAVTPETEVIVPRLQSQMRRQSLLIGAGLVVAMALSLAGFALGGWSIWIAYKTAAWNFVTRGFAFVAVSALLSTAAAQLLPVRASENAHALSEMIDLCISRASRTLRITQLGFYACAVAAVLGLAGTAIRSSLTRPPAMSPLVDLAILAIFALGLQLYRRHASVRLAKFEYLKRALAVDAT